MEVAPIFVTVYFNMLKMTLLASLAVQVTSEYLRVGLNRAMGFYSERKRFTSHFKPKCECTNIVHVMRELREATIQGRLLNGGGI